MDTVTTDIDRIEELARVRNQAITPTDESGTGAYSALYDLAADATVGRYTIVMQGTQGGFDRMARVVYNVSAPGTP